MNTARKPQKIRRDNAIRGPKTNNVTKKRPASSKAISPKESEKGVALKLNGEKGAETFTVPEETRIQFTKMLISFRENETVDKIEMPKDLTNTERKYLHTLAGQLGLKSKSSGKDEERKITITKVNNHGKNLSIEKESKLPILQIGESGEAALDLYIRDFPPDEVEAASSLSGGSLSKLIPTSDQSHMNSLLQKSKLKTSSKKVNLQHRIQTHHKLQKAKIHHTNFKQMQEVRSKLPALAYQKEICDIIRNNQVTLLSGDTGCGKVCTFNSNTMIIKQHTKSNVCLPYVLLLKSTQLPQFVLDDAEMGPTCKVCITQPRRISAISIAERVASERCEEVGSVVGYNIRLESRMSANTQLLFVTPGILLRKVQHSPDLDEFTHIVIDEIHERDRYTEFLMIVLKEIINRRSDLRIILMSATIQTQELLQYWTGAGCFKESMDERIPADISIPGRMFPVQTFFLEDVLAMTGFVNDDSVRMNGDSADLESDLSKLLRNCHTDFATRNGRAETLAAVDNSLICVLCNQSGFKCPEELGSHIGLCQGTGNVSVFELETKVRKSHVLPTWQLSHENNVRVDDFQETLNDFCEELEITNCEDDDEFFGLHDGHWDGSSPFGAADNTSKPKTSITQEEMLSRYQMIHDDELIDNDLILQILQYIHKSSYGDGAVLIFLPGWMEISELGMLLETVHPFSDKSKFLILPMHSGIPSKDQRLIFQRPRQGVRKIVLSTNICEASVTIDDVAFVIDTGRAKEKNYDPHLNTSTLQPIWINKASVKQRRGRAGRTKAGVCFHLFSRRRFESFNEFLDSEMVRSSLEEICLQCKKLSLCPGGIDDDNGIPAFLRRALTPPHSKAVMNAIAELVRLGAMEPITNNLTELGNCLSCLSVDPRVGKMIMWSYILGCSNDAVSVAVAMSYKVRIKRNGCFVRILFRSSLIFLILVKTPFVIPPQSMKKYADEAKMKLSEGCESDQILILHVLKLLEKAKRNSDKKVFQRECRKNFVNIGTLEMISSMRQNIHRELQSIGFPDPNDCNMWYNRNLNDKASFSVEASIIAGVYPNVAAREKGEMNFRTAKDRKAKMHISSVNACKGMPLSKKSTELEFVAYGELVKGVSSYTINLTTHLPSVLPIFLLCGNFQFRTADCTAGSSKDCIISIDEWISFRCNSKVGSTLAVIRSRLESIFFHFVSSTKHSWNDFSELEKRTLAALDAINKSSLKASSR